MPSKEPLIAASVAFLLLGLIGGYFVAVNTIAGKTTTYVSSTTIISSSYVTNTATSTVTLTTSSRLTTTTTVTKTNFVIDGDFEFSSDVLPDFWNTPSGNHTLRQTTNSPHSGRYALEFITTPTSNLTSMGVYQHLFQGDCVGGGSTRFGVAVRNGLEFSLWYRTPNSSNIGMAATVTYHNGTSKLFIDYFLAWRGPLPYYDSLGGSQGGQKIPAVLVNDSGNDWKQVTIDVYHDFIKYYGLDPVSGHYCVNNLGFGQSALNATYYQYPQGSRLYSYFDDVELTGASQ